MEQLRKKLSASLMGILLAIFMSPVIYSLMTTYVNAAPQAGPSDAAANQIVVGRIQKPEPIRDAGPQVRSNDYRSGELLVKYKPGISKSRAKNIGKSYGAVASKGFRRPRRLKSSPVDQWQLIKLGTGVDAKQVMERLVKDPQVERVELNYKVSANLVPNDTWFSELWGLHNTGQLGGVNDVDIDAPEAWDVLTGTLSPVVVAIIDTGVDYTHVDLAANIWVNPGEIAGDFIDNDGNGYVDDVNGYDFVNNDNDPLDDNWHGTHVAGTVGATGNNATGVAGVNWGAQIMALKFLDSSGSGFVSDAVDALLYAVDNGARVTNNSWGGGGFSQAMADAITTADAAGVLFVVAAGNGGADGIGDNNDITPYYPANYDIPNVISVASIGQYDGRSEYSNYGAMNVDLGAPGEYILSTYPGNQYVYSWGTSMAAPHVAGAASLLYAQNPARSMSEVKDYLLGTVDPAASMTGTTLSGGRLNVNNALTCNPAAISLMVSQPAIGFTVYATEPTLVRSRVVACGGVPDATVTASFDNGDADLSLFDDGLHGDDDAGDGVYANYWTPVNITAVNMTLTATHTSMGTDSQILAGTTRERVAYFREPVPYTWIDASSGTAHTLLNDSSITIPVGFNFDFYGLTHTDVTISSNGYLTFASSGDVAINTPLPSPVLPDNIISPFWDDLNPAAGGSVYSLLEGTAPNRRLTVAWVNVPHVSSTDPVSFEVTLYETSGDIVFQYQDTFFANVALDLGASATVGIEDGDGVRANLYSVDQPLVQANTAQRYYITGPLPELTYRVTINTTGLIPEGSIVMDFINGDGVNSHYSSIFKFNTEGALAGIPTISGGARGNLIPGPARLGDSEFVSEISQPVIYGNSMSFDLRITTNSPYLLFPDEFSFYVLDQYGVPYPTNDPLGTDALFAIDIDGSQPSLWVFQSSFVSVTLELISGPPVADPAGPYSADTGVSIVFDGSASSDADGDPLTYQWDFGDGATGTGVNPSHAYASPGNYTVSLVVNDGTWDSPPVMTIARVPANQLPVADTGGPYTAQRYQVIVFDASATTDAESDPLIYQWDFGDSTTGTGISPTHAYSVSGIYTVTLVVNDGFGNSSPVTTTATITNLPPVADAGGPYTIPLGLPLTLNGGGSYDLDGDSLTYAWDFGDSTIGSGVAPSHTYTSTGTYTVTLIVNDGEVSSPVATTTVDVGPANQRPIANPGGPYSADVGQLLTLDGSGSTDADGNSLTYQWDFGDGTTAGGSSSTTQHSYSSSGLFTVTLIVNDGYEDSLPVTTTVIILNQVPVADPGGPYTVDVGVPISFDGSASLDPEGDPLTYRWDFGDGSSSIPVENFEGGALPGGWVVGTYGWSVDNVSPYEGTFSLKSDIILDNQSTLVEVTDTFVAGNVSFAIKVSSEAGWDFLRFYIDGVLQTEWSGEIPWGVVSYPVTAGQHTLRWIYAKDSSVSGGQDTAWIDLVTMPKGDSATHTYASAGTYTVTLIVNDGTDDSLPVSTSTEVWVLDMDGDGVANSLDNCRLVANPAQRDTDGDNYGNFCDPDFDNNLIINVSDLFYLKSKFLTADPDADLNGDASVNVSDLFILKSMFLGAPGPSGLVP